MILIALVIYVALIAPVNWVTYRFVRWLSHAYDPAAETEDSGRE